MDDVPEIKCILSYLCFFGKDIATVTTYLSCTLHCIRVIIIIFIPVSYARSTRDN